MTLVQVKKQGAKVRDDGNLGRTGRWGLGFKQEGNRRHQGAEGHTRAQTGRRSVRLSQFGKWIVFKTQLWKWKVQEQQVKASLPFCLIMGGPGWWQMGPHSICLNPLTWIFLKPLFSLVSEKTEGTKGVQLPEPPTRLLKSTWRNSDQKPLIKVPTWCLFPENQKYLCLFPHQPQYSFVEGWEEKSAPVRNRLQGASLFEDLLCLHILFTSPITWDEM